MNLCFRLYDPLIGRFLSVDPLFEMQVGINPYHYCGNDPVNASDPSGLIRDSEGYEWEDIAFCGVITGYKECSVLDPGGVKYKSQSDWRQNELARNDFIMNYLSERMCFLAGCFGLLGGLSIALHSSQK